MAIESLAFLGISLYSFGVGSYLWLRRTTHYDRVPVEDPHQELLEVLDFLETLDPDTPLSSELIHVLAQ